MTKEQFDAILKSYMIVLLFCLLLLFFFRGCLPLDALSRLCHLILENLFIIIVVF